MSAYTVEVLVFVEAKDAAEAERQVTQAMAPSIGRVNGLDAWQVTDVRGEDE